MKKLTFALCFFAASFTISFAQDGTNSLTENLESLKVGEQVVFQAKTASGGAVASELAFRKGDKTTEMTFNFNGIGGTGAKVEFLKGGNVIHSYLDNASNGPDGNIRLVEIPSDQLLFSTNMPIVNQEEWWPVVVLIALCCVEAEISNDGWSVGFDCDCLSVEISASVAAGPGNTTTVSGFDQIRITPIDGDTGALAKAVLTSRK